MFDTLKNDGLEAAEDRLGGGGFIVDTDAYKAKVEMAYGIISSKGAKGVAFTFLLEGGKKYQETVYVTNQAGENFFLNKDDKTKKVPLPGYTTVNDICICITEKGLSEQTLEEKTVNVYDYEQKKDLPKNVPVLVDLLGGEVILGIVRNLENKSVKDGAGNYQPTADTRETNNIEKVFEVNTKMSIVEATNGKTAAEFHDKWLERNKGNTRDRRSIKEGGSAGTSGRPQGGPPQAGGAAAGGAPRKSLFGTK
jgi:hypothetical protein